MDDTHLHELLSTYLRNEQTIETYTKDATYQESLKSAKAGKADILEGMAQLFGDENALYCSAGGEYVLRRKKTTCVDIGFDDLRDMYIEFHKNVLPGPDRAVAFGQYFSNTYIMESSSYRQRNKSVNTFRLTVCPTDCAAMQHAKMVSVPPLLSDRTLELVRSDSIKRQHKVAVKPLKQTKNRLSDSICAAFSQQKPKKVVELFQGMYFVVVQRGGAPKTRLIPRDTLGQKAYIDFHGVVMKSDGFVQFTGKMIPVLAAKFAQYMLNGIDNLEKAPPVPKKACIKIYKNLPSKIKLDMLCGSVTPKP